MSNYAQAGLRNDVIFAAGKTQFGNALSAGLAVGF